MQYSSIPRYIIKSGIFFNATIGTDRILDLPYKELPVFIQDAVYRHDHLSIKMSKEVFDLLDENFLNKCAEKYESSWELVRVP